MTTRCRLRQLMAVSLSLAFGLLAACGAQTATPAIPIAAVLDDVVNVVLARPSTDATMTPVTEGYGAVVGSTIVTGDQSKVKIDFGKSTIVRLAPQTSITLEKFATLEDGVHIVLRLAKGTVLVGLTGGWLEIKSPYGNVALLGAYAQIGYSHSLANTQDDALTIKCLVGPCHIWNGVVNQSLGNLQQLVLTNYGIAATHSDLSDSAVVEFLAESPESIALVATLTAVPSETSTATATSTRTSLPTLGPIASPTLTLASATPSPTNTRRPAIATARPITNTPVSAPPTDTSAPPPTDTLAPPPTDAPDRPPPDDANTPTAQPNPVPTTEPPTAIPPTAESSPVPTAEPATETPAPPTSNPTRTLEPKETPIP